MHLSSNLLSLGLASILCNALHSHAHARGHQFLRGGDLPIPDLPSPEKLVGINWQLKEIDGVPAILDSQELFFEKDMEVSGYDGCNRFWGAWSTVESDQDSQTSDRPSITIGPLASHRKMCRLTGEAAEQQTIFMSALRQEAISFSLSVDESELTLYHTFDGEDSSIVLSSIPASIKPWGGQSLIGMKGEEAKAIIETINPSLQVQIIPEGWFVTADHRLDRVRIFVDEEGIVKREPRRG